MSQTAKETKQTEKKQPTGGTCFKRFMNVQRMLLKLEEYQHIPCLSHKIRNLEKDQIWNIQREYAVYTTPVKF